MRKKAFLLVAFLLAVAQGAWAECVTFNAHRVSDTL